MLFLLRDVCAIKEFKQINKVICKKYFILRKNEYSVKQNVEKHLKNNFSIKINKLNPTQQGLFIVPEFIHVAAEVGILLFNMNNCILVEEQFMSISL